MGKAYINIMKTRNEKGKKKSEDGNMVTTEITIVN